jgi:O-acetylhomoserine/O-acetylserine sulfhydrylase-like pyridoxal-dependent enzyme
MSEFGSIVTFDLRGGARRGVASPSPRLFYVAASFEPCRCCRPSPLVAAIANQRLGVGSTIRLSIGLESIDVAIDLRQALQSLIAEPHGKQEGRARNS